MSPFLYGLGFAGAEHFIKASIEHSLNYRPFKLLSGFVHNFPSIVSFAFLAGLGADWLTDKTNHTQEALWSLFAWGFTLLISSVIGNELWWLRPALIAGNNKVWKRSIWILALLNISCAVLPYIVYFYDEDITWLSLTCGVISVISMYSIFVHKYICDLPVVRLNIAEESIRQYVKFYSKRSPYDGAGIAENPGLHQSQASHYYVNRYYIAYEERATSRACFCRQEQLIEKIAHGTPIGAEKIKLLVSDRIQDVASLCELEFWTLVYIVCAEESNMKKALDILNKSKDINSEKIAFFNEFRIKVHSANHLVKIDHAL